MLETINEHNFPSPPSEISRIQSQMDSSPLEDPKNIDIDSEEVTEDSEEEDLPTPVTSKKRKKKQKSRGSRASSKLKKSPKKSSKTPVNRANAWEHFTRTKEDYDRCLCNYCKKSFACATKSGTSNLNKHLKSCKQHKAWMEGRDSGQVVINKEGLLKSAKVSETIFREACNELIVLAELPLSFIESAAWKHFCERVNLYHPHSRRTAARDIIEMYVKKKAYLKDYLSVTNQRVSLTTDIWVAQPTGASYMVVTAHFVNANWKLQKLIIGFKYVQDHKGETIARTLLECLEEWGIDKVFCITVDNATANTSAIRRFTQTFKSVSPDAFVLDAEFLHMRCSGHIINLIVQDGLAKISSNVAAVRNAVTYVRSSTPRLQSFEQKVESGRIQKGSLPLDVKTRWNSTYLMLKRALEFRIAFDKMEVQDRLYTNHFEENVDGHKRIGPPLSNDWIEVERLVGFLHIFYNSTLVVSASNSVNANKCYAEIVTIEKYLVSLTNSKDKDLKAVAKDMLEKFDKYWDGMKNINKMIIVATVFDPRKKMAFPKHCFERLYGKDSRESKELYDSVMMVLMSLFSEYNSRANRGTSTAQSTQSSQPSSSSIHNHQPQRMDMVNGISQYERMEDEWNELVSDIGATDSRDEMAVYLSEQIHSPKLVPGMEFDILDWWKVSSGKFPVLSTVAKDVLSMQVSSVASESAFSTSGRIVDPYRSCLTHYMIEVLMCTEQWLLADIRGKERGFVTNAEILSEVQMLDTLEKDFTCPGEENED